jgi:hypothetical protein
MGRVANRPSAQALVALGTIIVGCACSRQQTTNRREPVRQQPTAVPGAAAGIPSSVPVAPPATDASSTAPQPSSAPCAPPNQRRLLLWYDDRTTYFPAVDRDALRCLTEAERAAIAYLTVDLGSGCETQFDDGEPRSVKCTLTAAMGLEDHCGAEHRALVQKWFKEAPDHCGVSVSGAYHQEILDRLELVVDGRRIALEYDAVGVEWGPGSEDLAWSETLTFVQTGESLKVVERTLRKGHRPK